MKAQAKVIACWLALVSSGEPTRAAPLPASAGPTIARSEGRCSLIQKFGSPAKAVLIAKASVDGLSADVVLILPEVHDGEERQGSGRVILQPSGEVFPIAFASAPLPDNQGRAIHLAEDDAAFEPLTKAEAARFEVGEAQPVDLRFLPRANSFNQLLSCQAESRRSAGLPVDDLVRPVIPTSAWISYDYYPLSAVRAHLSGSVTVVLAVDESGKAKSCTVAQSSGHKDLDADTCRLLQRKSQFSPRHDGKHGDRFSIETIGWSPPSDW